MFRSLVVVLLLAGTLTAAEVKTVPDLAYGSDDRQKVDLFLPDAKEFPVVFFLHGGGFTKGDRKSAAKFGEALARQGIGVASAGYRLAPEHKHPTQVEDAARALAFVKREMAGRGGRGLFVAGHSAGGHLAALLVADERYLKAVRLSPADVAGVIPIAGPYRPTPDYDPVFGDEAGRKAASPTEYARAGLPPFLFIHADADKPGRAEQSREFAEALRKVKVEAEVIEAKDRDHSGVFTKITDGDPVGEAIIAFVKKRSAR